MNKFSLCLLSVIFLLNANAQTPRQIDNLTTFSKLYGYAKYFHPSDEAATIDWDLFAIYGSRKVENCKTTMELQDSLKALFQPIAPTIQIFTNKEKVNFNKEQLMVTNPADYKTIAWQHKGVGLGNQGNIYQSARTYRPIIASKVTSNKFAPLSSHLDAAPFQKKEFIFRGKVKMISGKGTGHLWIRVDRPNNTMGFFDNMNDRPIQQNDWNTYEIKGVVDGDASRIVFGIFLKGDGELWFDDMSLQVKEGNEWEEVYTNSFTNEEQGKALKSLYVNNSMLASYAVTVENKEESSQNFVSIKSKDKDEVRTVKHTTIFNQYPQVGEYANKSIGSDLKAIIPLALYGTDDQTYPAADKAQLERLKEALKQIPTSGLKGDHLYTRLGNLIITWNIFQHFYPYFDVAQTDWHQDFKNAISSTYSDKTEVDFQKTLQKLTAKLKDGHIRVILNTSKLNYLPPITWEWIENELVITHVGDTSLSLAKGDIVKKINGRDAKDYFNDIHQHISAATNGWLQHRAQTESMLGEMGTILNLEVASSGNALKHVALSRTLRWPQNNEALKKESIKSLGDSITYINIDKAPTDEIEKALPELRKSKAIICDLRGYPNANHKLIQYLMTEKDTSSQWMQVPQIIYPDQEKIAGFEKHGWQFKPEKPHLNAKIIFIIDGRAISYAESFMGFIEHYKLATIVGQPTAGTNGNINPFNLPGGYYISWTGMKVQKHDGSQHHGVGILPHVYVQKTIKGIQENRDEFLEKAIEIAKKPM
jgi:C-terminal processing protease CtpA/Prc